MQPGGLARRPTVEGDVGEDELDRADVARVVGGEVEAFAGIVRRWQGPLVNLAWRYCRDRGRAEEMAQEAFLKAYRSLASWRGEAVFSTWLIAIAINVYRSAMRRLGPAFVDLEAIAEPASPRGTADDLLGEDRAEAVRRAVSALPPRYRDPILLFYFGGMDLAEASRALRLAEGTMKARLHRARELLRRRVGGLLSAAPAGRAAAKEA